MMTLLIFIGGLIVVAVIVSVVVDKRNLRETQHDEESSVIAIPEVPSHSSIHTDVNIIFGYSTKQQLISIARPFINGVKQYPKTRNAWYMNMGDHKLGNVSLQIIFTDKNSTACIYLLQKIVMELKLPGSLPLSERLLQHNIKHGDSLTPEVIIFHNSSDALTLTAALEKALKSKKLSRPSVVKLASFFPEDNDDQVEMVHVVANTVQGINGRLGFPDVFDDDGLVFHGEKLEKVLILASDEPTPDGVNGLNVPTDPPAYSDPPKNETKKISLK